MLPIPSENRPGARATRGTSSSLLVQVQANDADAWRRFVQLYSPLVYAWAKRFGLQSQDAADILQEVFHAVARNIMGYRRETGAGSFRGWLWTITRNKVRDHFRDRRVEPTGGSEMHQRLQQIPEAEPSSWSEGGDCSRATIVARAAQLIRDDFEPHTWQAFWRLAVERQPASTIAADLEMTPDAVYQAKARVMRRLRQELEGHIE